MRRRDLTPLDASRDSDPGLSLKPRDSLTASSSASSTRHHQSVAAAATSTSSASDPFPHVPSKHHHGITRRQSPFPQQGLLPKHFQTPQHTRFSLKPKTKSSQSSLTSSFHRQSFPSNPFGGYSSFGSSFDTSPFSGHGREQVQHRPPPQQQLRPHHKQRPHPHTDPLRHRPHSQSFPPLRPHAATLPPSRFQEALFPSARPQTDGFPFTSFDDLYPTRPDSEPFLPEEAKPQPNDPAFHPPLDEQQLSYPPRPARPTPRPPHVLSQPTYSPHVPPRFPPALPPSSHPHFSHDVPESKFPPHFHIKTTTSPPATTPAATPRPPVHRPRPTTFRPRSQPSHPRHTTTSRPTTTTTTPPPPPPPSVSKTPPHVSRPRPTTTTTTRRPRVRSTTPKTTTFLPRLTTHSPRHVASHSPRQRPRPFLNSIETLDEYEDETNPFQNPAVEIRTQAPETTTRFTFPPFSKARSTTAVPFGGKKDDKKSPALAPPPQIPGTVRHPELSRLPASSLKTPDSPKTSPKHTQDNAKPSRYPVDPFP
ncbi:hypothetical protein E2C01_016250 [Portunus trituberculatus]|uniref:Uncharacterized protein n=1 Tax=Portunus trituberculatus TaxID=210409 RepID=A0A5B7DNW9_PORTR|nr:hypothetical protein [Portunus trituberculatus]